jgi:ATP-binding cassette, subfamily B, bacterial MsbA
MSNNKKKKPSIIALFKSYAIPFKKQIILLIFLSLAANFFTSIQPVLISGLMEITIGEKTVETGEVRPKVNGILSFFDLNQVGEKVKKLVLEGDNALTPENTWRAVVIVLSVFIIIAFCAAILNFCAQATNNWIRVSSTRLIRMDILQHVLSLNIGFFHNEKTGELISRFTQDATNTARGIGPLLHSMIHHIVLIIVYSLYLFTTNPWLTFGAIGIIFLHWGVTRLIKKPLRQAERRYFDTTADLVSTMQETLTSIRVIKSFGADQYEMQKLQKDIDTAKDADFKAGLIKHIEPHSREFLDSFSIAGIFIIAFMQLTQGSLSVQGFLLFIFIGKLLITPINKFSVNFVWIQALLASYERLFEIFEEKNDVIDGVIQKNNFQKKFEVKNIHFSYKSEEVIHDVSFELEKGKVLAIVGVSGAGKSTLTDMILRFYDPSKGIILIDGINLRDLKGVDYRKLFGVVSQESLLFNDTIANNIRFGRQDIDQKQIEDAAMIANAHQFIPELPNGYQTLVGDRGTKLSGGQRQRISIARAVCAKPAIIIFDEATSSLDTESERQVQNAIDKVLENSTAIIIAHRLSTILHADKIMVLNQGKIEAIGKHQKLLENSPIYRRLYQFQFDKEIQQNKKTA